MPAPKHLCPCESGKLFRECHGYDESPTVIRPYIVCSIQTPWGGTYKTIGIDRRSCP